MKPDELEATISQLEKSIEKEGKLEDMFLALEQYKGEDEVLTSNALKKELDNESEPSWQIKTGLPTLDRLCEGFRAGDVVVISAPTGTGKTKLAETFTWYFSGKSDYVLWLSFEIPPRELFKRFGDNLPKFCLPRKNVSSSLLWTESKIVEAIAKFKIKAVIIDHLHYLVDLAMIKNSSLELGAIMRLLKKTAIKYNIVIFIIAHTTKTRPEDTLTLNAIRDSSFIGQEADFVIMLSRKLAEEKNEEGKLYEDETIISVQKNRRTGKTGKLKVMLKDNKFEELTENY